MTLLRQRRLLVSSWVRPALFAAVLVLTIAAVSSCGSDPLPPPSPVLTIDERVFETRTERVITSAEELGEVWRRVQEVRPGAGNQPQVDFEREMLILLAAGPQPVGDTITVDSLRVRDDRFDVYYTLVRACSPITQTRHPLRIVRTRATDKQVEFHAGERTCEQQQS